MVSTLELLREPHHQNDRLPEQSVHNRSAEEAIIYGKLTGTTRNRKKKSRHFSRHLARHRVAMNVLNPEP